MTTRLDPASIAITSVIRIARAEVGTVESPRGSNRQKYGKALGMNGVRWCDLFVSWVYRKAGYSDISGGVQSYTPTHAQWFKARYMWTDVPRVGDIAFFTFGYGRIKHIGIVSAVHENKRGKVTHVTTIEGNTSSSRLGSQSNGGGVFEKKRSLRLIAGFGRPKYPLDPAPVKPPKPAPFPRWPLKGEQVYGRDDLGNIPDVRTGRGSDADGHHVGTVQMELNKEAARLKFAPLVVDGDFREKTEDAVKLYQTDSKKGPHPLNVTGRVGRHTWTHLFQPARENKTPTGGEG